MRFLNTLRRLATPSPARPLSVLNPAARQPLQLTTPYEDGTWPWPNIDSSAVQWKQSRVAFHEAGHTVVARYFGVEVRQLSIRLRDHSLGRMVGAGRPYQERVRESQELKDLADLDPDSPVRIPTDCLHPRRLFKDEAGFHAELHYNIAGEVAHQMRYGFSEGGLGDRRRFHSLISLFYGNTTGFVSGSTIALLRNRYWNSCWEILARRYIWAWTKRVAAAVVRSEHGVLTGDQIDWLGPCSPGLPPAGLATVA